SFMPPPGTGTSIPLLGIEASHRACRFPGQLKPKCSAPSDSSSRHGARASFSGYQLIIPAAAASGRSCFEPSSLSASSGRVGFTFSIGIVGMNRFEVTLKEFNWGRELQRHGNPFTAVSRIALVIEILAELKF